MKRVLVTGASGFIGRHVLTPLAERGYDVHAVSRSGAVPAAGNVHCHRADLLDPKQIGTLLKQVRPTHLLHFAWYAVPGNTGRRRRILSGWVRRANYCVRSRSLAAAGPSWPAVALNMIGHLANARNATRPAGRPLCTACANSRHRR